ncbi:hypothetical protein A4X09_0g1273 [Tilletia walkeri]|uniref:Neuroguidin n=1 Tax=Tilletia walkeri TaxID=117179 RepID=A0A8X7NBX6_9BASI|nr:hypothetical protein A4X09_0g1273 [Tilletia walkeri]
MDASLAAEVSKLIAALDTDTAALIPITDAIEERISSDSGNNGSKDGIPLLSLKNDALLSYIHHLVLLTAHRLRGNDLTSQPGSTLVQNLIRLRLVLEKTRPLEGKMRYQIDKALKAAAEEERGLSGGKRVKERGEDDDDDDEEEEEEDDDEDEVDPLAFRPNPSALMAASKASDSIKRKPTMDRNKAPTSRKNSRAQENPDSDDEEDSRGGVYKPPKLAPVPYDPDSISRKRSEGGSEDRLPPGKRNAALLADLSLGLSSNPYELSSAGLGGAGRNSASSAQASVRAKALRRMEEYEEENFSRLVMKKKDAKKRRRDEAAVALGGAGMDSGRGGRQGRLGAGLDEEFGDLLRGGGGGGGARKGKKRAAGGDAYDALRSTSVKRPKVSSGTMAGTSSGSASTPKDLFRSGGGRASQSQFSKDVARSRKKARS